MAKTASAKKATLPVKVAALGPKGSYTHQVAKETFPGARILFCPSVYDVFDTVEKDKAAYGVAAIENSLEGSVGETLDAFMQSAIAKSAIQIHREVLLPIDHCLVTAKTFPGAPTTIVAHPQALAQCRLYLRQHYPRADIIPVASNSKGAEMVKKGTYDACICSPFCAELYGLRIMEHDVQDSDVNTTRFVSIAKQVNKKTGYDKTSVLFYFYENRPGSLYESLSLFAERKINLAKVESRPSKKAFGEYIFYIDFEGHKNEPRVRECIAALKKNVAYLKILGSYPRRL